MGDERGSGSTSSLRHKLAAAEAELEDKRREAVAASIAETRAIAERTEAQALQDQRRTDERLDALEQAEAVRQVREEERASHSPANPAEALHSTLTPLQQISANAGGGGVVAGVLYGFGKLMGWW